MLTDPGDWYISRSVKDRKLLTRCAMRSTLWIIMISFCLAGCSEMRIIGNAAVRELRAESVAVNWNIAAPGAMVVAEPDLLATAKVKSFSSFRRTQTAKKTPVKGLWEKHGS